MKGTGRRAFALMLLSAVAGLTLVFLVAVFGLVRAQRGCGDHLRGVFSTLVQNSMLIGRSLDEVRNEIGGEFAGEVSCDARGAHGFDCRVPAICGSGIEEVQFIVEVDESMKVTSLSTSDKQPQH